MGRPFAQASPADTRSLAAQKTLTRAVLDSAKLLDISQIELADLLGVSPATVSRMNSGRYLLQPDRKEWQLAALIRPSLPFARLHYRWAR